MNSFADTIGGAADVDSYFDKEVFTGKHLITGTDSMFDSLTYNLPNYCN